MTVDELATPQLLEEFASRVRHYRVWTELHGFLKQYTEEAFREFTEFRDDDASKLMALRARWHARKEFQESIEALITDQAELQEEIKDEFALRGHDPALLDDLRSIHE